MAVTCDTTLDFASDTGYTYDSDDVEFVGGVAQLKAGFEGSSVIETPALDASTWDLHSITLSIIEALGYRHLFLVSFDDGDNWNSYGPSGWKRRDIADIETVGIPPAVLTQIREWPDATDLKFAIWIEREVDGGDGSISLLSVCRGEEILDAGDEPDGTDELAPNANGPDGGCRLHLGIMPDYSIVRRTDYMIAEARFDGGYEFAAPTASRARDRYDLHWDSRAEHEKDEIEEFIRCHQDEAFVWTPPEEDTEKKWVFGEPEIVRGDEGVFHLKCPATQVLPLEA
jgi:phage-related protein